MKQKLYFSLLLALCLSISVRAQQVAVKSNLLYDATATVNAGLELGLSPRWTLDVSGNFNGWSTSHTKKWKHWMAQPEFRYWLCDRFAGHFFGFHLQGGQFNVGGMDLDFSLFGTDFSNLRNHRYQGWFGGAGIAYGYAWVLGRHWNLEAEIGLGYNYTLSDKYESAGCGEKVEEDKTHHYFGPTKAAINLVYVF